jgi:FkbM family methyltransferase
VKRLVKSVLAKLGYQVQGTRHYPRQLLEPTNLRRIEFDDVACRRMFEFGSELTFIQVGAFDGITKDPLRKYINQCGWRGVLIEPQSGAANKLRELYRANDRIVILQAALDWECGKRALFTVKSPRAPAWAGALASFQRETIVKHSDLVPGLEAMIVEEAVDCITFDEVLEALQHKQIDVLQIDTEGADAHILSLFPLDRILPAIIHWEIKHLSTADREQCLERLARFGYRFAPSGDEDMLAVLN